MGDLFHIRDARPDDWATLNAYAYAEGMDNLPSLERVRVAVNDADEVVGFIRITIGGNGVAHINPVVTYASWRGYGVGRALAEEALAHYGELRLVSRGSSRAFYDAMGYRCIAWDDIEPEVAGECDGCEMRDECGPTPMGKKA